MKKESFAAALFFAVSLVNSHAGTTWTIGSQTYSVDTLYHATVGPGTTETELRIELIGASTPVTNNIFYTVTDLTVPYVEMRAAKAGKHMRKLETVPAIAERMNKPGERYFAGVNADFFNTGYPYNSIGMCIAGGFNTNYESDGADIDPYYIVFDEKGDPTFARHIDRGWTGTVRFPQGEAYDFHVNTRRNANDVILYTPQWQLLDWDGNTHEVGHTGTNQYGVEIQLQPVGQNVLYGNTLQLKVVSDPEEEVGNMAIPSDGYVLSAHGDSNSGVVDPRNYLLNLKKGDIVTMSIDFSADDKAIKAKELLGGFPRIVTDGSIDSTPSYPGHLSNREPRTAVGHNADKSRLYMVVVDGRNAGGSAGVTQQELAAIMKNIGCSDAMNFDGGGSSTMYVDGLGVKNVPSSSSLDPNRPVGVPRVVVNALFAVSTAPVDNVVARIELRDKKVSLSTGETYTPVVYAYNQYGVLIDTDLAGCKITMPEELGSVDGTAVTASDGRYSGLLTAEYNGYTHSVPVYINGGGQFVTSSVEEAIISADSPAEYFLINGVRVSAPVRGQISLRRQGGAVVKTLGE